MQRRSSGCIVLVEQSGFQRRVAKKRGSLVLAAAAVGVVSCGMANASTLNFDPAQTPATPSGGTGTWDPGLTANWALGGSDVAWTDTTGVDTALFGSTGGTVTLTDTPIANAVIFNSTGYTLTGGTLTLAGTTPAITTNANATIGSFVTGTDGITKAGAGTLTVTGVINDSGATHVAQGVLKLQNTIATPAIDISSGATLQFDGDLSNPSTTTITGSGTLLKTGAGTLVWAAPAATFAMSGGALIDVEGGTLTGGSYGNDDYTNNLSGLKVAAGASFDGNEANVIVDALSGSGTIRSGFNGAGYTQFTFGVNNGGGTFGGNLSDSVYSAGSYRKVGTGTQILTGASTYTGALTISAGTLQVGDGGASGSLGTGAIIDNANLAFNRSDTVTITAPITGTGTLTQAGTGTTILTSANTYGGTTISGGTLQVGDGGTLGSGAVVDNASLVYNLTSGTVTLPSGSGISGSGNLTVTSPNAEFNGNIALGGSQTYSSGSATPAHYLLHQNTVLSGSSISMTGLIGQPGSTGYTLGLDTSASNGPINLDVSFSVPNVNYPVDGFTANAGKGALNVTGTTGTATWQSAVSLTGAINISTDITYAKAIALHTTGNSTLSNVFALNQSLYGYNPFNIDAGATLTASGQLTGVSGLSYGGINKLGQGTLVLSNANNSYAQGLQLNGGTVQFLNNALKPGNGGAGGFAADFQADSTLKFGAGDTTDISGGGTVSQINIAPGVNATFDTNGINATFASRFYHATGNEASITLNDTAATAGKLTLGGASVYTAGTTITRGTLVAANTSGSATGTGTVTVSQNGVLAGTGSASGPITVAGTITGGTGTAPTDGIGTLTTGAETWATTGTFVDKVQDTVGTNDKLSFSGLTASSGFTIKLLAESGFTPQFTASNSDLTTAPVAGSYIVLATDLETSNNPFASLSSLAALNLVFQNDGVLPFGSSDQIALSVQQNGSGYNLIAESVVPEPGSLALLGFVVGPMALRRRSRR